MKIRSRLLVLAPLASAVLLVANPAAAAGMTMTVSDTGYLMAKGATVSIQVTLTCSPASDPVMGLYYDTAVGGLTVTQSVRGGKITMASGDTGSVACDEQAHLVTVYVIPQTLAFQKGTAVVTGSAAVGGYLETVNLPPTEIRIK